MKIKNVSGVTVTDLGLGSPFGPDATIVAINLHSSAVTLQQSDASTGPFATITGANSIPVNQGVEVIVTKRYVALEGGAGQVVILQN